MTSTVSTTHVAGQPNDAPELVAIAASQQGGDRGAQLWGIDRSGTLRSSYQLTAGGEWSKWSGEWNGSSPANLTAVTAAQQNDGRVAVWVLDAEGTLFGCSQTSPGGDWTKWSRLTPVPATLQYGQVVSLQNGRDDWQGGFLAATGPAGCGPNSVYNATTVSKEPSDDAGAWRIESADGKSDGEAVTANDSIYLRNQHGSGTYLNTCDHASCDDGSLYRVSTATTSTRDGLCGTWRVVLGGPGELHAGETVRFLNGYHDRAGDGPFKGGYLDTCGEAHPAMRSPDTIYDVVTNTLKGLQDASTHWRLQLGS